MTGISRSAPGERALYRERASAAANDEDAGQPIADLPPLIEPGLVPSGRRPPRRSFLAGAAAAPATAPPLVSFGAPALPTPPAATIAPAPPIAPPPLLVSFDAPTLPNAPPQLVSFDIPDVVEPELIEPVAAPPESPPRTPAPRRATRLWMAARATRPATPRAWLTLVAGIAVALVVIFGLADVLRIGPFSRVQSYPVSGAPKDPAQRLAYFQSGAQAGDANAALQLAILYAKGDGTAQDYATAATWFRAAANQGVARAQYDLGVLYERGRGVQVDLTEAANWYLKAAQGNFPLAQYNLAVCYTKGQGIRKDLPEAALWYRRAASQGVVQAMANLGMMYEKGEGVAASPVDAYAWYLAAGQRSNQAAAARASEVFANLPRLDQIRAEALASDVSKSIHDADEHSGAGTTNP
jgi:hypothetical protein